MYIYIVTTGPLSATIMVMWPAMKLSLTPLLYDDAIAPPLLLTPASLLMRFANNNNNGGSPGCVRAPDATDHDVTDVSAQIYSSSTSTISNNNNII